MTIRTVMGSLVAVASLFAAPALAQIEAQEVAERIGFDEEQTRVGLDVRLGFGALTGDVGDDTSTGPLLGIAAGAQVSPLVGGELGLEGQRLPISDTLVGEGEALYRYNVDLLAKVGPLLQEHWRPFAGVGVGLTYINPTDGADFLYDTDILAEVPLTAGVDYNFGELFAGARATYRLMFFEGFADDVIAGDNNGSLFNVNATIGGRF